MRFVHQGQIKDSCNKDATTGLGCLSTPYQNPKPPVCSVSPPARPGAGIVVLCELRRGDQSPSHWIHHHVH